MEKSSKPDPTNIRYDAGLRGHPDHSANKRVARRATSRAYANKARSELKALRAFCDAADLPPYLSVRAIALARNWDIPLRRAISLLHGPDEGLAYWSIARHLGLPYVNNVVPLRSASLADKAEKSIGGLRAHLRGAKQDAFLDGPLGQRLVIAPEAEDWLAVSALLAEDLEAHKYLAIATPRTLQRAAVSYHRERLVETTLSHLDQTQPGQSAETIITPLQGAFMVLLMAGLTSAMLAAPVLSSMLLTFGLAMFFACAVLLRLVAIRHIIHPVAKPYSALPDADLPRYTVLVPLYDEAKIVPQLFANLSALDYPLPLLDIKIIVEADDLATIQAVERHHPGAPFHVVRVPPSQPRTKPKALNYALHFAEGELVCIFDAEDRPQPDQLRRAAKLLMSDPRIGAVQCQLSMDNADESFFSRQFALDYDSLFKGILPALDHLHLPVPLGGTSNHFRLATLEDVGAWDPYNVTEDADLGLRLARLGYLCRTLDSRTFEEAPIYFSQWLPQRTRWFKGWVQSWLVHMRNPRSLWRDLGWFRFLSSQVVLFGMFLSAALHPFFAVIVLADLVTFIQAPMAQTGWMAVFAALNLFNFLAGYLACMVLTTICILKDGAYGRLVSVALMPLYWWLMALAAWRALFQLFADPFKWEKTPHGVSRQTKPY